MKQKIIELSKYLEGLPDWRSPRFTLSYWRVDDFRRKAMEKGGHPTFKSDAGMIKKMYSKVEVSEGVCHQKIIDTMLERRGYKLVRIIGVERGRNTDHDYNWERIEFEVDDGK